MVLQSIFFLLDRCMLGDTQLTRLATSLATRAHKAHLTFEIRNSKYERNSSFNFKFTLAIFPF